jgi:hypothetical protein
MTFAELTTSVSRDFAAATDDPASWFGPLSKTLADWRKAQQISGNGNLWAPPVSIRTAEQSPQRSALPIKSVLTKKTLSEELFDALASFKIKTSTVAMYLDDQWRLRFFRQLDSLLDQESWDREDKPPSLESFSTMLRMLLLLAPERRPGLGATSDGNLVAAWTVGDDRLTVQALRNDRVKWVLSCNLDGARESAAGSSTLSNFREILSPYRPDRWFRAQHLPQT